MTSDSMTSKQSEFSQWLGPLSILLDEETFNNNSKLLLVLALLLSFRIITFFQKDSLQVYYNKNSNLMRGLMKESKIKEMTYVPHTFALNGHI